MFKSPLETLPASGKSQSKVNLYSIRPVQSKKLTGLGCWVATPRNPDPSLPPLVAVHGVYRDVEGLLKILTSQFPHGKRSVIAPVFDKTNWHGYQRVLTGQRADLALLSLLKSINLPGITDIYSFDLLGYSGGAQFAHRFALLYPHLINRLALCSAGWYTFPDDSPYPYGLAKPEKILQGFTTQVRSNLSAFLRLPIEVFVGECDTDRDPNLRKGKAIDRQQGRDRVERATNWVKALNEAASDLGIESQIKTKILQGCGHDFRQCVHSGEMIEHWLKQ
ncbi:MAG TPA: alpha/beta hydrolase [Pelovirga sp.]|nr:alpha/beta hydrolase [Pelovirga sp.]